MRPGVLSQICSERSISRERLSREIGVSASTLYRLDRGDSAPSARLIALLIGATGMEFELLFEIQDVGEAKE